MSAPVDAERLRYELARRGLEAIDLARKARISPATVSAALAGRPVSMTSLTLIARVLESTPVNEVIDRLLVPVVTSAAQPARAAEQA